MASLIASFNAAWRKPLEGPTASTSNLEPDWQASNELDTQIPIIVPPSPTQSAEDSVEEIDSSDELPSFPAANSIQRVGTLPVPTSTKVLAPKPRRKVILEPGHSGLDWARLKSSGSDLRGGVTALMRVTPSELAKHRMREDAWSAFGGRVYNITPYLKFHPGGVGELMRAAGRDGTELFMKTHAWISVENMMDSCMVGILVRE